MINQTSIPINHPSTPINLSSAPINLSSTPIDQSIQQFITFNLILFRHKLNLLKNLNNNQIK